MNKIHYISLGEYCAPAQVFERLNIKEASYPFDWLYSIADQNLSLILEMLKDNSIENVYHKYITFKSKDEANFDRNIFNQGFPHETSVFTEDFKEKSKNLMIK